MDPIQDPSLYSLPFIEEDVVINNHFIKGNITFYEKELIEGSPYGDSIFECYFDPNLRIPCVVKKIFFAHDDKSDKFFRELYFLTHLKSLHPVLVEIFGWNKEYIVLEKVRYSSLAMILENRANRRTFTPTQKTKIALGIAHVLRYLHKLEIVYCDLSLNNILIDENLEPKLCDFGNARYTTDAPSHSGTDSFLPPELLRNDEFCNPKSDVYSFGIFLYCLAFENHTPDLKAYNIENQPLPYIDIIEPNIRFLINFCRNDIPSQRCNFDQIIQLMINGYTFENTNNEEIMEYYQKLEKETAPISEFEP